MQQEITKKQNLLRKNGSLAEVGYAKHPILQYDRSAITASKFKIKEWDYYLVMGPEYAIALTIADNSYMAMDSISLIDFKLPWHHTKSPMRAFSMGKLHMPASSEAGHTESFCKNHFLSFRREENCRKLTFHMGNFYDHKSLDGEIALGDPGGESVVMATPFETDPQQFYYNRKINCLPAHGYMKFGDDIYTFKPDSAFGVMDWGRGVWPRRCSWYWGSASGLVKDAPFGFNIGYGFGDTSAATENMIFYQNKAHKISKVVFHIPESGGKLNFMEPWFFTSDDDRFKMVFQPIVDRTAHTNLLGLLGTNQHQVFGRYTGRVTLDDGTVIRIKDFLGFAEKVENKW